MLVQICLYIVHNATQLTVGTLLRLTTQRQRLMKNKNYKQKVLEFAQKYGILALESSTKIACIDHPIHIFDKQTGALLACNTDLDYKESICIVHDEEHYQLIVKRGCIVNLQPFSYDYCSYCKIDEKNHVCHRRQTIKPDPIKELNISHTAPIEEIMSFKLCKTKYSKIAAWDIESYRNDTGLQIIAGIGIRTLDMETYKFVRDFDKFIKTLADLDIEIAVAHNGAGYDMPILIRTLESKNITITKVMNAGNKLIMVTIHAHGKKIKFIDSCKLFPGSLDMLAISHLTKNDPTCRKTIFPYAWYTDDVTRAFYVGPPPAIEHFPKVHKAFNKKAMSVEDKERLEGLKLAVALNPSDIELHKQYEQFANSFRTNEDNRLIKLYEELPNPFDADLVMREYLKNDCDILALSLVRADLTLINVSGVSPLRCVTAASLAMKVYSTYGDIKKIPKLSKDMHYFSKKAMAGGRTEVFKKFLKGDINSVDFNSLYPYVMTMPMPCGAPWWIYNPTIEQINKFLGIVEVNIKKCPKTDKIGLLHEKIDGKLCFTHNLRKNVCFTAPEIRRALEVGYEFEFIKMLASDSSCLFADYIKTYYEIKSEASKNKDAGLKATAKLLLNSLWGKFGQRIDYAEKLYISDDQKIDDLNRQQLSGRITYTLGNRLGGGENKTFQEVNIKTADPDIGNTNILLASHVTAYGRLTLYNLLEKVGINNIIYCDTDSAYFNMTDSLNKQIDEGLLSIGDDLGQLKYEVTKGEHMLCLSPKSYSIKNCFDEGVFKSEYSKCKGMPVGVQGSTELHDIYRALILGSLEEYAYVCPTTFSIKTDGIYVRDMAKKISLTEDKREFEELDESIPFGF